MSDEIETVAEAEGQPPDGRKIHRRWMMELEISGKGEKDWRDEVEELYKRYRGEDANKNSYNIFWANTEITRAASYNSLPKPDVRRRYRDKDQLGKAMGEMLRRALEYTLDVYHYHECYKRCVLDALISGRGVHRLRYKPTTKKDDQGNESLSWECVMPEHVQWCDFRHGAGKTPDEWTWMAYRHRMTRDEMVEMFGKLGVQVPLDTTVDDELKNRRDEQDEVKNSFKTGDVWEIWDKTQRRVLFIAPAYTESPLLDTPDPLGIDEFFNAPMPLYAIEETDSTTPTPVFRLYKEQAEELDRTSARINKIIQAVKFRGIYDSTISEMEKLMNALDNDFVPADNVSALIERGGLEKGIWTWPVNTIAQVLQYLYDARERTKAVIYELTGISDVVRGSTKASETLGAQQLKAEYAGMRIGRLQSAIQDYIRNSIRIVAGIIAEKFSPQTLMAMTNLQYPSEQQLQMQFQQQMMQWQQAAMLAQQQGHPPPPRPQPTQGVITIEAVMQALRSNMTRSYKIDIETDSTIQATLDGDIEAIGKVGQAVQAIVGSMGPMVQSGVMPMDAMKEMIGAVTRRARLGNAVEDALDSIGQGQQQGVGAEAQKQLQEAQQQLQEAQQQLQQEQQKLMQEKMQVEQGKAGLEMQAKQGQIDAEAQMLKVQAAMQKLQGLLDKISNTMANAQEKATATADAAQQQQVAGMQQIVMQTVQEAIAALTAPKQVVRDAQGRIAGVQTVGNAAATVQ